MSDVTILLNRINEGDGKASEELLPLVYRETLALVPLLSEESRITVATTRSTLASTIADHGRFDETLQPAGEAVDEYENRGETDSANFGFSLTVHGGLLAEKGEYAKADADLQRAELIFRKLFSAGNLWTGDNLRNQALSLYGQGRYNEAIKIADEAMKMYEEGFGKQYDNYPTALIAKGLSLAKTGRATDGEIVLREAVKIRSDSLPKEHFWVALAKSALGECLTIQQRYGEAEPLLAESYEDLRKSQGENNPRTEIARQRLFLLHR